MKIKAHPEHNYKAIFTDTGTTLHLRYDSKLPYGELEYPEIYDVAINNLCYGGCQYCYIAATKRGHNYANVCDKAHQFFGGMTENQRPLQIAIGGAGEATLHPEFPDFLKTIYDLGIMPNYTTNGMHLTPTVLTATAKYVGGVAVTCHKHLKRFWQAAIDKLAPITRLNLHIIPMSIGDVDDFVTIFDEYKDKVEYFVLLPYQAIGFGKAVDIKPVYDYLFDTVLANFTPTDLKKVAYGAYFYDELVQRPWINADIYEHGLFSKYLDMDNNMTLFRSSYEWATPLKEHLL